MQFKSTPMSLGLNRYSNHQKNHVADLQKNQIAQQRLINQHNSYIRDSNPKTKNHIVPTTIKEIDKRAQNSTYNHHTKTGNNEAPKETFDSENNTNHAEVVESFEYIALSKEKANNEYSKTVKGSKNPEWKNAFDLLTASKKAANDVYARLYDIPTLSKVPVVKIRSKKIILKELDKPTEIQLNKKNKAPTQKGRSILKTGEKKKFKTPESVHKKQKDNYAKILQTSNYGNIAPFASFKSKIAQCDMVGESSSYSEKSKKSAHINMHDRGTHKYIPNQIETTISVPPYQDTNNQYALNNSNGSDPNHRSDDSPTVATASFHLINNEPKRLSTKNPNQITDNKLKANDNIFKHTLGNCDIAYRYDKQTLSTVNTQHQSYVDNAKIPQRKAISNSLAGKIKKELDSQSTRLKEAQKQLEGAMNIVKALANNLKKLDAMISSSQSAT